MKQFLYILFVLFPSCLHTFVNAQVKSEGELVQSLLTSLQNKDSRSYINLFPGIDSMAAWVFQYAAKGSEAYNRMQYLQGNYMARLDFDSTIHEEADKGFKDFLKKGSAAGVHWDRTIFVRYELEKIRRGRGLISEKIAPLRFLGYVFIKDMLTRKTFAFTVFDIMQVNGLWYGGELANIFEASSREEYEIELAAEKKRIRQRRLGITDSTDIVKDKTLSFDEEEDEEQDKPSSMKEVLDRKFYKGQFDNDISVQLYVRYIRGGCPEVVCSWEALFKFGDQDEYVKMAVSRTPDGKWLFSEDLGGMELTLDGNVYTGSYASSSDKTEYEAKLVETPIPLKKVRVLDEILEFGAHGK